MLVDWQPDLHGVVSILAVDLVQIEAIVHRLLNADDVVIVTDIKPVVKHGLHPALAMQKIEADLTAQKLSNKEVSLPLQILDDARVHLR